MIYKNSFAALALCFFSSAVILGCGDSARGPKGAAICTDAYEKANLNIDVNIGSKKTKLGDDTQLDLKTGEYNFKDTDIYVQDKQREIKMHVSIKPLEGDKAEIKLNCIGGRFGSEDPLVGISRKMVPFQFSIPVPGKMQVAENGAITMTKAHVLVDYRFRAEGVAWTLATYEVEDKSAPSNLKDLFKGFDDSAEYVYEYPNKNLEIRSSYSKFKQSERNSAVTTQNIISFVRVDKVADPVTSEEKSDEKSKE